MPRGQFADGRALTAALDTRGRGGENKQGERNDTNNINNKKSETPQTRVRTHCASLTEAPSWGAEPS